MPALLALLLAQPRPVSLAQAVELAEAHGPDVLDARAAVPVAKAGVEIARQWPNPTLSVSVGSDDPAIFGGIDQRLPVFGQLGTAIDAAEAEVRVAEQGVELTRVRLLAEVRRAYFALAATQRDEGLAAERIARQQRLVAIAKKRLDLGSGSELELSQASLALARAQQAADDRRAATVVARLQLARLLGVPAEDGPLEASDPLLPLPRAPALDDLLSRLGENPEVVLARREAEAARARATREGAAIRPVPDVSLEAQDLQCSNPFLFGPCPANDPAATALGLRLSLAFDVPVLSQNRGAVHQAEREADRADSAAALALARRRADVRAALASLDAARRRSGFLEETAIPEALHVEQLSRVAYEVGRVPLVVLLQAEADVTDVREQAVAAAAEAQGAFADVEEAVGAAL